LDKAALREALSATKDYVGVTGKISIDGNRNAVKSAVVLKIAGGAFKFQTTIAP
jgi:branched-chain amino acid transport system substrate-binding protein